MPGHRPPLAAVHLAQPPSLGESHHTWFARPKKQQPARHWKPTQFRPAIEALEDRWAPNDPLGTMQAPLLLAGVPLVSRGVSPITVLTRGWPGGSAVSPGAGQEETRLVQTQEKPRLSDEDIKALFGRDDADQSPGTSDAGSKAAPNAGDVIPTSGASDSDLSGDLSLTAATPAGDTLGEDLALPSGQKKASSRPKLPADSPGNGNAATGGGGGAPGGISAPNAIGGNGNGGGGGGNLHLPSGPVIQQAPQVYQLDAAGNKQPVAISQVVTGTNQTSFQVGSCDTTRPLIIDPSIVYSSYLGGNGMDVGTGIAVDGSGAAYVTGSTASTNFPTQYGLQTQNLNNSGGTVAFVTKVNPAGTGLVYSTYLGGTGGTGGASGACIAVELAGNAYITGSAGSFFPTTAHAYQTSGGSVFVAKLSATGDALEYSTYLGSGNANAWAIAVDASGEAFVTGSAPGTIGSFPVTSGAFQTTAGGGITDTPSLPSSTPPAAR